MPCAMIHTQPTRPTTRSAMRSQAGGSEPSAARSGGRARTSRTMTKMNDRATVVAAPTT